jgi:hypothetical protein
MCREVMCSYFVNAYSFDMSPIMAGSCLCSWSFSRCHRLLPLDGFTIWRSHLQLLMPVK